MHCSRMKKFYPILLVLLITLSCRQPVQPVAIPTLDFNKPTVTTVSTPIPSPTSTTFQPVVRRPDDLSIESPTPDVARQLPEIRSEVEQYIVQRGDSLGKIAAIFEINV